MIKFIMNMNNSRTHPNLGADGWAYNSVQWGNLPRVQADSLAQQYYWWDPQLRPQMGSPRVKFP
jgi:hypothetical protein